MGRDRRGKEVKEGDGERIESGRERGREFSSEFTCLLSPLDCFLSFSNDSS